MEISRKIFTVWLVVNFPFWVSGASVMEPRSVFGGEDVEVRTDSNMCRVDTLVSVLSEETDSLGVVVDRVGLDSIVPALLLECDSLGLNIAPPSRKRP